MAEARANAKKAEDAAKAAKSSENLASNYASTATASARTAQTNATNASTYAVNASVSANNASNSASQAKATLTDLENKIASGDFHGKDGRDGKDGKDGQDGYTPVKGKDYFDGKDGKDGRDGVDGKTPVKGTDYYTDAEKAAFVKEVEDSVQPSVSQLTNQIVNQGERITALENGGGNGDVVDTNADADLDFADESGNVIMRLSGGHVKPKISTPRT